MLGHLVSNSVAHTEPLRPLQWFRRLIAFLFGRR